MTSEEKFEKSHEIIDKTIADLKKIGFTRYVLYTSRDESWMKKHESTCSQGATCHIYGSLKELVLGLSYVYGMMCQNMSDEDMKEARDFVDKAFDCAESTAKTSRGSSDDDEDDSDNDDTPVEVASIKLNRADVKNMTLEEIIDLITMQAKEDNE